MPRCGAPAASRLVLPAMVTVTSLRVTVLALGTFARTAVMVSNGTPLTTLLFSTEMVRSLSCCSSFFMLEIDMNEFIDVGRP